MQVYNVFFHKLKVSSLFPIFCRTQNSIAVLGALLSHMFPVYFVPPCSVRFILILSFLLRLGLPASFPASPEPCMHFTMLLIMQYSAAFCCFLSQGRNTFLSILSLCKFWVGIASKLPLLYWGNLFFCAEKRALVFIIALVVFLEIFSQVSSQASKNLLQSYIESLRTGNHDINFSAS